MSKEEVTGKYLEYINNPENDTTKEDMLHYLKWAGGVLEREILGEDLRLPEVKHALDFGYCEYALGLVFFTRDCLVREENPTMYLEDIGKERAKWQRSYKDQEVAPLAGELFDEIFRIDGGIGNAGGVFIEMFYRLKEKETLLATVKLCARILVVFLVDGAVRQIKEEVALIEQLGTSYIGMKRDGSGDGKGGVLVSADPEWWYDPYNGQSLEVINRLRQGGEITDEWIWEQVIKNGYDKDPLCRYYYMKRGEKTGNAGMKLAKDRLEGVRPKRENR